MEPSNTETMGGLLFGFLTVIAGILAAYVGRKQKPPPPEAASVTLSGALIDNRAMDPLLREIMRLNDNLERAATLQEQEVQQAKQLEFQEQVVETALAKLRREMELNPAPMPKARPRPER